MVRLLAPLLALMLLSACGFEPVYADRSASSGRNGIDTRAALRGIQVSVMPPNTRQSQILKASLEDAIYPGDRRSAELRYELKAIPQIYEWPAVIQSNQFVARTNVRIVVRAQLLDAQTQAMLWAGSATRQSSFNIDQADFASYVARDDAIQRGFEAAAEDMAMQLQVRLSEGLDKKGFMNNSNHDQQERDLLPDMRNQDGMQTMAPY